jgi:hypothetical protein
VRHGEDGVLDPLLGAKPPRAAKLVELGEVGWAPVTLQQAEPIDGNVKLVAALILKMDVIAVDAIEDDAQKTEVATHAMIDVDDVVALPQIAKGAQTLALLRGLGDPLARRRTEDLSVGEHHHTAAPVDEATPERRHHDGPARQSSRRAERRQLGKRLKHGQVDPAGQEQLAQALGMAPRAAGNKHLLASVEAAAELLHDRVKDLTPAGVGAPLGQLVR